MKEKILELADAIRAGKVIQFSLREGDWGDITEPAFDARLGQYRVKPEPPKPKEIYVNEYASGLRCSYDSEQRATQMASNPTRKAVLYREVIE
jgi:hypothetical protein